MKKDRVSMFILLQMAALAGSGMFLFLPAGRLWAVFLLAVAFLISLILLYNRNSYISRLTEMEKQLKRAVNGNLKTRLFANEDGRLNEVIFLINELVEQLEKVQIEAIASHDARKSLLSSISHDIRTPLTSIIGYVDALKDGLASSEVEKQEYLGIISRKANGLKDLIDEIFSMAKLDADEIQVKPEEFDFAEMSRETVIEFLPELKKQELRLAANIPEERCPVFADRISVIRIINNLIENSIHYGKEGGVLGIELIETPQTYELSVWDQGQGISKEHLPNIFERMYRADQSRNSATGGSGLGLSIARALAEKNGGEITAESRPWEKTSFTFSLPKIKK